MKKVAEAMSKKRFAFLLVNVCGSWVLTPGADLFSALIAAAMVQVVYEAVFGCLCLAAWVSGRSSKHAVDL